MLNVIATLATLFFSYYYFWKYYRKCKNQFEKTIYILFVVSETFIVLLYYLDRYNVPTMLGWNENVDTQNWLSILSGFGTNILAEILGGVILFFVTIMQLNRTLDDNRQRDKEERRINNLPLLSYKITNYYCDADRYHTLPTIFDNEQNIQISLSVKNIGMNAVKDCYIEIISDAFKENYCFRLQEQGCIDKGDEKSINCLLNLNIGQHTFFMKVYYEDLINNWYLQEIKLLYPVSETYINRCNQIWLNFKVYDEIKLNEKPQILNKLQER